MKQLAKKTLSILLCLCLLVGLFTGLAPKTEATIGSFIGTGIAKKSLELGLRFACSAASEMVASTATETDDKVVGSFIQYIILDGNGATLNKIDQTCQKILKELAVLEQNMKDYTNEISTALYQDKIYNAQSQFAQKWETDVTDVLNNSNSLTEPSVQESLDTYVRYLIATYLHVNGMPQDDATAAALKDFWKSKYLTELTEADYSADALDQLKLNLEKDFLEIYDPAGGLNSREAAYNSAYIYNFYTTTINRLVDNYLYNSVGTNDKSYSVVECAATDAYYLYPFSHQQYEFVSSVAKRQIFTVTLLEMALNEYLSMQGDYLKEHSGNANWRTEVPLTYLTNAGTTASLTYDQCATNYADQVIYDLDQANILMEADIHINTLAYTGEEKDLVLKLSDYMKPEDAQLVTLSVNGYASSHDYLDELVANDFHCSDDAVFKNSTNVTKTKYIPENLKFYRVMSGNTAQEVYYILDTTQFENTNTLTVQSLAHRIERTNYNDWFPGMYGDLYVASNDYLNMIKPMSDGSNRYSVPANLNNKLTNLFDTPIFGAKYGYSPAGYLQKYISGSTTHFLTASYDNRIVDDHPHMTNLAGTTGLITLGKVGAVTSNACKLETETLKHQNILDSNPGRYTAILTNSSDTYQQTLSLKVNETYGPVEDAYIVCGDSQLAVGGTKALTPGETFTVRFKLSEGQSASLTMVRKNAVQTTTVLLDYADLNYLECDEDGYYSFTTTMPYSPIDIVITTTEQQVPEEPPVKYASATLGWTSFNAVKEFRLEYNGQYIRNNQEESMEVICGDTMELALRMASYDYLDRVTMITDGVETTLFNQDNYSDVLTAREDGTYSMTVTMPEKDTKFMIYTVSEGSPILTLTRDDPREAIYQFNAAVGELYVSSEPVPAGSEVTLNFWLKGQNAFHELTMVTGGQRTVLLDKQTFLSNASGSTSYSMTFTMPGYDTEIILSTIPIGEAYEPTDPLQINEEGKFLIYTYDDLRSMAYFINNNMTWYTSTSTFYIDYVEGDYILMNDIDVENRELETISKNSDVPFSGSFEGNGYTISNFTILADSTYHNSLFGFVDGEIRNLKLAGQYTVRNVSTKDKAYPSTLAYKLLDNGSVRNIQTQVTLALEGFASAVYVSGIAYSVEQGCVIDRCLIRDTVDLDIPITESYAGLFNSSLSYNEYSISNCGVLSTVNAQSCKNAYGLFNGGSQSTYNVHNCYSACTFSDSITNRYALFNTDFRTINATNCYYLDTLPQNGNAAAATTMAQFNSGEIAYLLQNEVKETDADGNKLQTWGQNIDGEGEKDLFPIFSDNRVYYKITSGCCDGNFVYGYTNFDRDNITHNYETDSKPATCTEDGYTTQTCPDCGDTHTEVIPATGHSFDEIVSIVESTCTEEGSVTTVCTRCGEQSQETMAPTGHYYLETARVEPTCTEDGSVTYTCQLCGDTYTDILPATGHDFGDDDTCDNCDEVTTALKLLYPTLTFKDEVMYNIYFDVYDLENVSTDDMGMILFDTFLPEGTIEDASQIISGAEATAAGYKVSSEGIPAKKMGDNIHFRIYIRMANGEYLYTPTMSYSAVDYAQHILIGDNSQEQKDIVIAMLEYGTQAQLYFNYRTDSLMNACLTAEQLGSIESYCSDMMDAIAVPDEEKTAAFAANDGFKYLYPSVNFTGAFAINYYCAPVSTPEGEITLYYWNYTDCYNTDYLTTDNATGSIAMIQTAEGYTAAVEGIAAKDLDKGVYIAAVYSDGENTYRSGVISYSIGMYCQTQAGRNNALSPLGAACAVYGYYAKQLFYK